MLESEDFARFPMVGRLLRLPSRLEPNNFLNPFGSAPSGGDCALPCLLVSHVTIADSLNTDF